MSNNINAKICPLLMLASKGTYGIYCEGPDCAWWRAFRPNVRRPTPGGVCAILEIAQALRERDG